ncbi:hypothetical protein [Nocardia sp. NBC_00403]|uniref:hypothetical protein n=1 Tax=Nocardia sp. NBC_00403 TaxID=2975990 RepID=UPI002E24BF36
MSRLSQTTHSTARKPGKRERLTAAAATVLHQQGVEKTSLADIAHVADVPDYRRPQHVDPEVIDMVADWLKAR